jgi:3-deoxy-7-phosphoheptulonate synthase
MPVYDDQAALKRIETEISRMPPLVFAGEARNLQARLAKVAEGQAFPASGRRLRRELQRIQRQ